MEVYYSRVERWKTEESGKVETGLHIGEWNEGWKGGLYVEEYRWGLVRRW